MLVSAAFVLDVIRMTMQFLIVGIVVGLFFHTSELEARIFQLEVETRRNTPEPEPEPDEAPAPEAPALPPASEAPVPPALPPAPEAPAPPALPPAPETASPSKSVVEWILSPKKGKGKKAKKI